MLTTLIYSNIKKWVNKPTLHMIYETTTKGSDVVPEPVNETSARKFMTGRTPAELDTPPVSIIEP